MHVWIVRGVRLPNDHERSPGAQEATVGASSPTSGSDCVSIGLRVDTQRLFGACPAGSSPSIVPKAFGFPGFSCFMRKMLRDGSDVNARRARWIRFQIAVRSMGAAAGGFGYTPCLSWIVRRTIGAVRLTVAVAAA
jgi:hypothetical protein